MIILAPQERKDSPGACASNAEQRLYPEEGPHRGRSIGAEMHSLWPKAFCFSEKGKSKLFKIQEDISEEQRLNEDSSVAINSRQRRTKAEL